MKCYRIRDWDRYQYRKIDPGKSYTKLPWIKLHRSILQSSKWHSLSDSEKGQFISLLLVANDHGDVDFDTSTIRVCAGLRRKPDLAKFLKLGLIEVYEAPVGNQCAQIAQKFAPTRIDKSKLHGVDSISDQETSIILQNIERNRHKKIT